MQNDSHGKCNKASITRQSMAGGAIEVAKSIDRRWGNVCEGEVKYKF